MCLPLEILVNARQSAPHSAVIWPVMFGFSIYPDDRDNFLVLPQSGRPIVILDGVFWHIEQFIGLA
jgi:hypothetical protein